MQVSAIHFPYFNQQDALIKIQQNSDKAHFILGTNSYMLRHQGAILRGFNIKKGYKYTYLGASRTLDLYVFDSYMESHVNVRRGLTDGLDREKVVTIQRVLNLVILFLRAGEFMRNQAVFKVRLVSPGS